MSGESYTRWRAASSDEDEDDEDEADATTTSIRRTVGGGEGDRGDTGGGVVTIITPPSRPTRTQPTHISHGAQTRVICVMVLACVVCLAVGVWIGREWGRISATYHYPHPVHVVIPAKTHPHPPSLSKALLHNLSPHHIDDFFRDLTDLPIAKEMSYIKKTWHKQGWDTTTTSFTVDIPTLDRDKASTLRVEFGNGSIVPSSPPPLLPMASVRVWEVYEGEVRNILGQYGVGGLRITRVGVPSPVVVGEDGWLECEFVEEGENVYALKWYLGLEEFYRWTPAETPSVRTFPVRGKPMVVDGAVSNRGRVRFSGITLGATGVFRCEVSAEGPSFHTESEVATMTVVDLPDEKPRLTGVRESYHLHQDVRINCTSPRSQPPATLTFYVNNQPADPSWLRQYSPIEEEGSSGLETAVLGLHFPLRPGQLVRGPAVVKCTAVIEDRYLADTVVLLHSDVPLQASIMEGRATANHGCKACRWWLVGVVVAAWLYYSNQ
ncbi:hypothetical protein Pmani_036793 [Petrolisthes manimaculis]|uniref:Ig-like domain-containing protein n=1 Tax=Petrolisthes manimaculis TaxID=1843537 RepID=A0AAE1NHM7_9EUCA|nr:hypothetical protein Pmani_036793 [Petrolisthes manimaculis]